MASLLQFRNILAAVRTCGVALLDPLLQTLDVEDMFVTAVEFDHLLTAAVYRKVFHANAAGAEGFVLFLLTACIRANIVLDARNLLKDLITILGTARSKSYHD